MNMKRVNMGVIKNKILDVYPNKKSLTISEALNLVNHNKLRTEDKDMTKAGLIYWCKKYNLGKKVFGRWEVNKARLLQLLKSREDVIHGNF